MCFALRSQWLSMTIMEAKQLLPDEKRDMRNEKRENKTEDDAEFIG
jgi:hypothetical protein